MGFVKKVVSSLTGADVAADATERGAEAQAAATRSAAEATSRTAQEAAAQAARQQEQAASRAAAQGAAEDALNRPMENPDVQLTAPGTESAAATSRRRRQTFGVGTASSGVNI